MRRIVSMVCAAVVAVSLLSAVEFHAPTAAHAAEAADFDPSNIISDEVFYNGAALNWGQIQTFAESKVPTCRSSYACLTNFRQNTPTMAATTFCNSYAGTSNELASQIIAKVGAACGVSQKVLLVLLEKEQSLVTSSAPGKDRFDKATGFSCPDTAPCDPAYSGFFYQVYNAARQFKNYASTPTRWNYQAGRTNYIRYHPNVACGSAPVFIRNQATAGLYIYTPYQPNAAALANMYGTGDGCSAYGNRNFWRIFSDWFGSPTISSSLLRTEANATVYLVSGKVKHPVTSLAVLSALSPMGKVTYVSQAQLDKYTTAHVVGRSLRAPDGTIYFYDAGIKLPFISCGQAVDYGASCADNGYVQLTAEQIGAFHTGPALGPVLGTVEGSRYYVTVGTKREILDARSQAEAGLPAGYNVLTENALAALPLGAPVVRDSAYALKRASSTYVYLGGGQQYPISPSSVSALRVPGRTTGGLSAGSLAKIPVNRSEFTGMVSLAGSQTSSVLSGNSRLDWAAGAGGLAVPPIAVSQSFLDSYPSRGSIAPGSFIKAPSSGTVYVVMPKDIRPIAGWDALLALTASGEPVITGITDGLVASLPKGVVALTSGTMVRSPQDATVYLINGVTNKIPFSSFDFPIEAGVTAFSFASQERLNAYPMSEALLYYGLTCGATNYVAAGGSLHKLTPQTAPLYPFSFVALDAFTCQKLAYGADAGQFIRTPDGTIYHLVAGQKRPIMSLARWAELSGGATWLSVKQSFAGAIPTGPAA